NACAPQTATATYTVIVNPLPTATAGGSQTICSNGTATVSGASATNGTIAWTENGAGSITSGINSLTPVYAAAAGDEGNTVTLTMTVTSTNACASQTATATYTVVVNPLPTATGIGTQTICVANNGIVSGMSSSNGTILWTSNGLGSILNPTSLTPTYQPAAGDSSTTVTMTMTVTSTNACAPQTAIANYTFIIDPLPTANASATAGGTQTICSNDSATVSGASASNGTIQWTHNGLGTLTNTTTITPTYTPVAGDAGTTVSLTLTVTSNNACNPSQATAVYTVIVDPLPTASAGGTQTICSNGTATVSGASASNGTIQWTHNGLGTLINSTSLTPTYSPVSGDEGDTITLLMTVTSNNTCGIASVSDTYTIIVDSLPTASAGDSQSICFDGNATVNGANAANGTIQWNHNGSGTLTNSSTLTPTYTPGIGDAGNTITLTMTVTSVNACGPQTAFATYSVIVNPLPTASISGTNSVCKNDVNQTITFIGGNGTAPYTFTYNINGNAPQTIVSSGNSATINVSTNIVGTFTYNLLSVEDASSTNCSNPQTGSAVITINALPTATISGSTSICVGNNATVTFTGTPNSTVTYTLNGGANQTVGLNNSGNGILNADALLNDANYSLVQVTTNSLPACSQLVSGNANIVVVAYPPSPSTSPNTTYCVGESIVDMTANSSASGTLIWYSDEDMLDSIGTGTNYMPLSSSSAYFVTETNSIGCKSEPSQITINVINCEVIFPTAFTPDGDKVNDTWIVENLDNVYPNSVVRIFNRWGNIVFESEAGKYEQYPWDGKINGDNLPVASYYFSIEFNDNKTETKKGIVTIIRK
ncbi:MAG: gliding motility-associated C-terminal domain-containing protein, partial [Flavobacteriia bacterium]|nr:gliding motility-associated C-terminal domain-containing protein [Flavobacteriia bacterium]